MTGSLSPEREQQIRFRHRAFTEMAVEVVAHEHGEKGCRCLSCDITTGYLVSVGVDCDETPNAEKTHDGGCLVDVLTYDQAKSVIAAHEDRGVLLAELDRVRAELANRVAAIAQVRETCARLYTDPDEETNPYRVGQDKMADLILEQLDEHSRRLPAVGEATR